MEMNITTSSIFLRCPENLHDQLKAESKELGFRSVQEYILQILRERKSQEAAPLREVQSVGT